MRIDWCVSPNDKVFGRFSFSEYESKIDKRAFPLLLGTATALEIVAGAAGVAGFVDGFAGNAAC